MASDVYQVSAFHGDWIDPGPTLEEVKAAIAAEGLDATIVEQVGEFSDYLVPFTEQQAQEFEQNGEIEFTVGDITFYAEDY